MQNNICKYDYNIQFQFKNSIYHWLSFLVIDMVGNSLAN